MRKQKEKKHKNMEAGQTDFFPIDFARNTLWKDIAGRQQQRERERSGKARKKAREREREKESLIL